MMQLDLELEWDSDLKRLIDDKSQEVLARLMARCIVAMIETEVDNEG